MHGMHIANPSKYPGEGSPQKRAGSNSPTAANAAQPKS